MPVSNPGTVTLRSKVILADRAAAAASGDVAYTGVGFRPSCVIMFANAENAGSAQISIGNVDEIADAQSVYNRSDLLHWIRSPNLIYSFNSAGDGQRAAILSYDPDGFTLTWTKVGTPGFNTRLLFICLR